MAFLDCDQRVDDRRVELGAAGTRRAPRCASCSGSAFRYERSLVIALNASQQQTMRAIDRDLLAREPVRVAGPVPALVAGADDPADLAEEAADAERASARPSIVCALDDLPLLVGERARLVDDLVRDRAPCRRRGAARRTRRRAALGRDKARARRATASVRSTTSRLCVPGVRVVGLDHVAEQERRAAVRVAQLELVVDPDARAPARRRSAARRAAARAERRPGDSTGSRTRPRGPTGARPRSIT